MFILLDETGFNPHKTMKGRPFHIPAPPVPFYRSIFFIFFKLSVSHVFFTGLNTVPTTNTGGRSHRGQPKCNFYFWSLRAAPRALPAASLS